MTTPAADSTAGPAVVADPGTIPPPREGNVAYFANLSAMFFDNDELTEELRLRVTTLKSYGGRLLPIICLLWNGDRNLLLMERLPLDLFFEYFGRDLNLKLPRVHTFDPHRPLEPAVEAEIQSTPNAHLDGFVTDHRLIEIADRTGSHLASSLSGSLQGNDKVLLNRFLQQAGEPVFDGVEVTTPSEVAPAAEQLARRGYRYAVVKSAIGASGVGLVRFETSRPPDIPNCHFHHGPCLVEGWLDPSIPRISHVASPSVQMVVMEHTVYLYDITDQILGEDSVHEGNVSPPESFHDPSLEEELLRQAGVVGRWLHAQGYRGTASSDFHLAFLHSGDIEVRVCELNARVTGATYPSLLARHFQPEGTWLMRNLRLPEPVDGARILDDLDKAGLLFRPGAQDGVLPINLNVGDDQLVSKGQFLFLGRNLNEVHDQIDRILSLEDLLFDRD